MKESILFKAVSGLGGGTEKDDISLIRGNNYGYKTKLSDISRSSYISKQQPKRERKYTTDFADLAKM